MVEGFKGVLGVRVSLPFHFILQHTIDNLLANNAFHNVLGLTIGDLNGRRASEVTRKGKGTWTETLELGDVEDGMNLHPRWEVQFVGDGRDSLDDGPRALVLETKLGGEIMESEVLGGEKNTIPRAEGIVSAPHVSVLGLAVLGGLDILLGGVDVVMPTGEELFRGSVVAGTGGAGEESGGRVRVSAAIKEERSEAG